MKLTEIIQEQMAAVDNAPIYPHNKRYVVTSCNNCPFSRIVVMAIGYDAVYCKHPIIRKQEVSVEGAANTVPAWCPLDDM